MTAVLPPKVGRMAEADAIELACRAHLGVWSERKRGMVHTPMHWEWNELAMSCNRLAVVAPREHAKTATFTVNQSCWRARYEPGIWGVIFSATDPLAEKRLTEIKAAMKEAEPWMTDGATVDNANELTFANGSTITVAGAGKKVRGGHPDFIVGDDVLDEQGCMSSAQRKKTRNWWFGTVAGMGHGGDVRTVGEARLGAEPVRRYFPGTKIHLVGTPFHSQDLLLSMKTNPLYTYRRYAAEFDPADLVPGTMAVEAN